METKQIINGLLDRADRVADQSAGRIMRQAAERLKELDQEQMWIPVTERLPEKWYETDEVFFGEPIEFIVLIEGALCATTLCFNGKNFFDVHTDDVYDVTHWMPLPEPPKEVDHES